MRFLNKFYAIYSTNITYLFFFFRPDDFPNILGHPVVIELTKKYKKTPAQILLRFLIQQDIIVIPKSSNPERISENLSIFDFELDSNDTEKLEALDKGEKGRIFNFFFFKGVTKHPEYPFDIIEVA